LLHPRNVHPSAQKEIYDAIDIGGICSSKNVSKKKGKEKKIM